MIRCGGALPRAAWAGRLVCLADGRNVEILDGLALRKGPVRGWELRRSPLVTS